MSGAGSFRVRESRNGARHHRPLVAYTGTLADDNEHVEMVVLVMDCGCVEAVPEFDDLPRWEAGEGTLCDELCGKHSNVQTVTEVLRA